jgi:hypothetical protein
MSKFGGKDDYHCDHCGNYITDEHGGIQCDTCSALFCCDDNCVGEEYLPNLKYSVGQSQGISGCRVCYVPNTQLEKFKHKLRISPPHSFTGIPVDNAREVGRLEGVNYALRLADAMFGANTQAEEPSWEEAYIRPDDWDGKLSWKENS